MIGPSVNEFGNRTSCTGITLELQLTVLQFVKSIRTASFDLYLETLEHLIPWVYALDHIHYARNLPIHLRDMCALQGMHPTVHQEFMNGKFVGQKTGRAFSSLALDQIHEQLIGSLKGDGGIIGLTEDPVALERFMITGPEISSLKSSKTLLKCVTKSTTSSTINIKRLSDKMLMA